MRSLPWLLLAGCGLTLDLEPPADGGVQDAGVMRVDTGVVRPDAGRDAQPAECRSEDECFVPDCVRRACVGGTCVDQADIACAPSDACHELTGTCDRDGSCGERLIDEDDDGFASSLLGPCGLDCDDSNADVSPGRPEVCDAIDHDCDGVVDEGVATTCGRDEDGDGYGSREDTMRVCAGDICPDGFVDDTDDCWDGPTEGILPGEANPLLANPDQRNFFTIPRDDGSGSFDWDCDGILTPSFDARLFVSCEGVDMGGGECRAQGGWESAPPACGEQGTRVACLIGAGGMCTASVGLVRNACR